jgi:perosamine synthetase
MTIELTVAPNAAAELSRLLRGGWVGSAGPLTERCESAWAAEFGRRGAVAFRTALTAYEALYHDAGIGAGAEVILPANAPLEAALALVQRGATAVPVDIDRRSRSLTAALARPHLNGRTAALFSNGLPDRRALTALRALADAHGLLLIEERRAATPAAPDLPRADWTLLALQQQRAAAGGAVLLRDDAAGLQRLRDWRAAAPLRAMTNLQAVQAFEQVLQRPQLAERRRTIGALYCHALAAAPALQRVAHLTYDEHGDAPAALLLRPQSGLQAAQLLQAAAARGIELRPAALLLHRQPLLRRLGLFAAAAVPQAEQLSAALLLLPNGPHVGAELVQSVMAVLEQSVVRYRQ